MNIRSYDDLKAFLRDHPLAFSWYGPRLADVLDLGDLIDLSGVIACYGSGAPSSLPILINDRPGYREKCSIDTLAGTLIENEVFDAFISATQTQRIVPYDSTPELEAYCNEQHVPLLSSPESLKDVLRDKTRIDDISQAIGLPAIPGVSGTIDDFAFEPLAARFGLPVFLHFAEGAGGTGNWIVHTRTEFEEVKRIQHGKRLNAKQFFEGASYTVDICVTAQSVICGTLEEMLIGAEPLNSNPTEYVASSWFENGHDDAFRRRIRDIGVRLGTLLQSQGFRGCFHPDFLVGDGGEIFLTELNMRFGGSCGAYARMQVAERQVPMLLIHALTFAFPELTFDAGEINEQNLRPLDYGLVVFKNNFGRPVTVPARYRSGLYTITNGELVPAPGTFIDLHDSNIVLLTGLPDTGQDTLIGEGAFMCEAMVRFPISDAKSQLNAPGRALVDLIRSHIIQ